MMVKFSVFLISVIFSFIFFLPTPVHADAFDDYISNFDINNFTEVIEELFDSDLINSGRYIKASECQYFAIIKYSPLYPRSNINLKNYGFLLANDENNCYPNYSALKRHENPAYNYLVTQGVSFSWNTSGELVLNDSTFDYSTIDRTLPLNSTVRTNIQISFSGSDNDFSSYYDDLGTVTNNQILVLPNLDIDFHQNPPNEFADYIGYNLLGTNASEAKITSNGECTVSNTANNTYYYEFTCPSEFAFYKKSTSTGGYWLYLPYPAYNIDDYYYDGTGGFCENINQLNYNLKYTEDNTIACPTNINREVDKLLPEGTIPTIDKEEIEDLFIDNGFGWLFPLVEWAIDAYNGFANFIFDFAKSILLTIIPDTNNIDFHLDRLQIFLKNKFTLNFDSIKDIRATSSLPTDLTLTLFGSNITFLDMSDLQGLQNSTIRTILTASLYLGIGFFSLNNFSNILSKRKIDNN